MRLAKLLCVPLVWMSAVSYGAESLEKVVAMQQVQIAGLIARDKQHDEKFEQLSRLGAILSRFKYKQEVLTGLSGGGSLDVPKISLREGGTYLVSVVANQAGSSTTYFSTIVRTTNGRVGSINSVSQVFDYVGSQIIKSVRSNNYGDDTILNIEYAGMLPTGNIAVTVWFLN